MDNGTNDLYFPTFKHERITVAQWNVQQDNLFDDDGTFKNYLTYDGSGKLKFDIHCLLNINKNIDQDTFVYTSVYAVNIMDFAESTLVYQSSAELTNASMLSSVQIDGHPELEWSEYGRKKTELPQYILGIELATTNKHPGESGISETIRRGTFFRTTCNVI